MKQSTDERRMRIAGRTIDDASDCFVIAEIGHNHQGSVEICKQLFKAAKECGVDAVKLQKRHNRSLYTKAQYEKSYDSENAFGDTYGKHREALEFGKKEYAELTDYAKKLDLIFFATAWDFKSADFLENLDVPCYKIASGDLTNTPLLQHVARKKKPVIVSTGGSTIADVRRAYEVMLPINRQIALLQCTASYPSEFHELDLRVIRSFRKEFPDAVIGFSAHDNGIAMSVAAYVMGARIIEKHFTLNRVMKGTDHAFSLEPIGMRKLVRDLHRTKLALGASEKKFYDSEKPGIMKMRKKIVAARDLPIGHILTAKDFAFKSPGDGLAPYEMERLVGKKLKVEVKEDDAVMMEHVKS